MTPRHTKPSPDQLTLHLGPAAFGHPPCLYRHRRHQMLNARAQWWFSQMRRKVEDAPEAIDGMPHAAKTAQSPTSDGKQCSDAGANMHHDSFQM